MPELTFKVTDTTRLSDLQTFTEQLGYRDKIRARQEPDGITLYVSTKKDSGIKNFFTGQSDRRQDLARDQIRIILQREQTQRGLNQTGRDDILGNIQSLPDGELRGSFLKPLVRELQQSLTENLDPLRKFAIALNDGNMGMLEKLTDSIFDTVIDDVTDLVEYGRDTALPLIYDNLMLRARAKGATGDEAQKTYNEASNEVKALVDRVYDKVVVRQDLNTRYIDGNKTFDDGVYLLHTGRDEQNNDTFDVVDRDTVGAILRPDVEIDGVTYRFDKQLGRGGFGVVDLYVGPDDQKIVLKTPVDGVPLQSLYSEMETHSVALGQNGHPNVVGLKGGVLVKGEEPGKDKLLIALDFAPGGDLEKMGPKIDILESNGEISHEVAGLVRARLVKDMIEGIQHFNDSGLLHMDVKPPNFLIGEDGKLKVTDFGTGTRGETRALTDLVVDNPIYKAPEIVDGEIDRSVRNTLFHNFRETRKEQVTEQLRDKLSPGELRKVINSIKSEYDERTTQHNELEPVVITQKVDAWSVGVSAYQLYFKGQFPLEVPGGFNVETEQLIQHFGSNSENRVIFKLDGQYTDVDHLINGLMHPDPDQRSFDQALQSTVFSDPRLDSDELRELVGKISRKEQHGIGHLTLALEEMQV